MCLVIFSEMKSKRYCNRSIALSCTRAAVQYTAALTMNGQPIERVEELIHLGVWISSDLSWDKHVSELCRRAYPRVRMITKLKYVGVPIKDLIELYCLFTRSLTEYCSTLFHSSLSPKLQNKIEAIQRTCLRVILGVMYVNYTSALEMCGLQILHMCREHRSLNFALKCTQHQTNKSMFPLNPSEDTHDVRHREKYKVNKTHTETYQKSTIPFLQNKLNTHHSEKLEAIKRASREV